MVFSYVNRDHCQEATGRSSAADSLNSPILSFPSSVARAKKHDERLGNTKSHEADYFKKAALSEFVEFVFNDG